MLARAGADGSYEFYTNVITVSGLPMTSAPSENAFKHTLLSVNTRPFIKNQNTLFALALRLPSILSTLIFYLELSEWSKNNYL